MSITKFAVSGTAVFVLLAASVASAQGYGSCVNLSSDLSYGQKGSQVSQLQQFLVAQNYPGGGAWMATGYFGQATMQAVRNFQQSQGLPTTGVADGATRAAINRVSCGLPAQAGGQSYLPGLGGTGYTYNYNYNQGWPSYTNTYPYNYNYNYGYNYSNQYGTCGMYPYFYSCPNTYGATPHLTSFSVPVAVPGSPVTIYGTGFDAVNNSIYVGGTTLSNISSPNGTSLTFTMPANVTGTVSVSVANSRGTSNSLTLSTGTYGYPYNQPYSPCGYGYSCPSSATPVVSYLTPEQGGVGTSVTIYGSGFSATGNSVHFGNGVISNLMSFDGHSVSFVVPSTLSGYGYQPIGLGTYQVSVTNASGASSNTMSFTITSLNPTGVNPTISNVSGPTALSTGVSGTWTITVQNPSSSYLTTTVNWGDTGTYANPSTQQTTTVSGSNALSFSHAYSASGTYTITFTVNNGSGQQATASATVSVSGSGGTGSITLSSVSPNSGRVGTQLMLQGNGFDAYNNTVHFGNGGTMHVPSQGGVIYYTVPAYISPCDVTSVGGVCARYAQLVSPGSYNVYVTSQNGTSNTLTFQVLQ